MADTPSHELPAKIETYLAALSRIYRGTGKVLQEEILVNGEIAIDEAVDYDNWNGGTYGHDVALTVPETLFMRVMESRESLGKEICDDLNKLNKVRNEYISNVSIEMKLPEDKDWRSRSPVYHAAVASPPIGSDDLSRIWGDKPVRVFLSHKATVKVETSRLKSALSDYGIGGFVAHEDIEPTEEWHREIERALFSMDALVALLTGDYHDSNWTDQEVGVALGRGVPVIAVRLGMDPYGLMGKRQGLGGCDLSTPDDMAAKIYALLCKRLPDSSRMFEAALDAYSRSTSFENSGRNADRLFKGFEALSSDQIQKLLDAYKANGQNKHSFRGRGVLMPLLKKWTGKTWGVHDELLVPEDEIPDPF